MHRGYSSEKKCWLYGLYVKRMTEGILRHYIIPDNDKGFKVFLYNKKEYEVISESIGAFCESINAYDGDIVFQNGEYGVLREKKDIDTFFIEPARAAKTDHNDIEMSTIDMKDMKLTGETFFKKENIICSVDKSSRIHFSMIGKEYGKMCLERKAHDSAKKEIVKTKVFFEELDQCLAGDKDWFISEFKQHLDKRESSVAELLPYLQLYVNELAAKQECFYVEKEYDNFEICSFNFSANGRYYNISSVLGNDTITTVFRYKKKPKGQIVNISPKGF